MSKKTTLKDWVRDMMMNAPIVTAGPSATVKLTCQTPGEIRIERIRMDWWEDEDFRYGYEALRQDEGWNLSEACLTCQTAGELECWAPLY